MTASLTTANLSTIDLTAEAFEPFGVVLEALEDGTPFTPEEAALDVSAGIPRFYIMQLHDKPLTFKRITRHLNTTQTLMSVGLVDWFLAVAPAGDLAPDATPRFEDIVVFKIPGNVAITMNKGTWHAGPFFHGADLAFVNLELSDTNVVDHHTFRIDQELGLQIVIEAQ